MHSPALATVVMHAIRRDPDKRYACMQAMIEDLRHLDETTPVDYIPDPPKMGGRYRQTILIALLVLAVCLILIAFGVFAQFTYHLTQ